MTQPITNCISPGLPRVSQSQQAMKYAALTALILITITAATAEAAELTITAATAEDAEQMPIFASSLPQCERPKCHSGAEQIYSSLDQQELAALFQEAIGAGETEIVRYDCTGLSPDGEAMEALERSSRAHERQQGPRERGEAQVVFYTPHPEMTVQHFSRIPQSGVVPSCPKKRDHQHKQCLIPLPRFNKNLASNNHTGGFKQQHR